MKLFSKPGACSTADHIALNWAGLPYEAKIVTASQMKEPEFLALNPAGSVPVLVDGDFVLTQNAAIMGYISDSAPAAGLTGDGSKQQRANAMRWLAYVNSDVHPAFKPIFNPANYLPDAAQADAVKAAARANVQRVYQFAEKQLDGRDWLAGFRSVADPYLYITLRWAVAVHVDMTSSPNLLAFMRRMEADSGVEQALAAEHLKPMAPAA
ncbi:MAG: glutathione S-transferase N-terminal domain-containing protein [Proteobacteria bacterium]|nr:glutathione S-transferase N-terminal domain-containing protein [Pseudomonadota bacterium]MBS0219005.1 glutathione S-transferase N-terminal domain-containing protein [Pseudomonadota bacterium]